MKKTLISAFFTFLLFTASAQNNKEWTAIKTLLEKESATWRSGDVKGHAACWHIRPYSRIIVSLPDTVLDVPPALMINPPPDMIGEGGYSVNSNYKWNISGNNAWVSHDELSVDKDGNRSYSYEIRMLEKINGKWKLVGQSIHIFKKP